MEYIHYLVWNAGTVPGDWVNAIIVTIPKKGDLSSATTGCGLAWLTL